MLIFRTHFESVINDVEKCLNDKLAMNADFKYHKYMLSDRIAIIVMKSVIIVSANQALYRLYIVYGE